jgi:hypothetical protein
MLARGDVVIQRLVPEIRSHGEISLMFFAGVFSHAVSKRPKTGEFRVQERLGGMIARTEPPPQLGRACARPADLASRQAPCTRGWTWSPPASGSF